MQILQVNSLPELCELLESHGNDLSQWGTEGAKTLEHLFQEIEEGESELIFDDDRLLRHLKVASIQVFFREMEKTWYLIEEKQVFKVNGHVRRREMPGSVSEKLKIGEDVAEAMDRGIREELGLEGPLAISIQGESEETAWSVSYPGILTRYQIFTARVDLSPQQFRPEGYVEDQEDKQTFFVWNQIE